MANDVKTGVKVAQHLRDLGIETPHIKRIDCENLRTAMEDFLDALGMDTRDDSISGTGARLTKMYGTEILYGLDYNNFPKCTTVQNRMKYDEVIVIKDINVMSLCEHHFVPFTGVAHIGYIPRTKVLGLSKFNRIVDFFARRPQVQERLTEQIAATLKLILGTQNVAVVIKCTHMCVKLRGVKDQNSTTTTSKMSGYFRSKPELRAELLELVR